MEGNRSLNRESRENFCETKGPGKYYSVELNLDGLDLPYQFRIWTLDHESMCVLVKENSDLLPRLKVGDTLKVKYYSLGSESPPNYQNTEINRIVKNDQGRLKGHYLVSLEIQEG